MENELSDFINFSSNESFLYLENFKLVKLTKISNIYFNHIRNNLDDIYINSVTIEFVNHTKDYHYISQCSGNYEKLKEMYEDIHNVVKNELYLTSPQYSYVYPNIKNASFTETIVINKNVFFCSHYGDAFAHTLGYFYPTIYYYYLLKKYIPDLVLIITYQNSYTEFLLDILNIEEYIVIKNNERIINEGTTYFAGALNTNLTENLINKYYYDIIVKKTLSSSLSCLKSTNDLPKKILFLRSPNNIVSAGFLSNREEIVNLAAKYNYVDIDQTKLNLNETIQLVNNATHIILESGSSLLHLLWSKNIKSIVINYKLEYFNSLAYLYNDADEKLKLTSNNFFVDIVKVKKSKIVYNDYNYIKTGIPNDDYLHFTNMEELQKAIEETEKETIIGVNNKISDSAIIHKNVCIGDNNFIGDNVIIYPNTTIGNNNNIFKGNVIGEFPINSDEDFKVYDLNKGKGVVIGDNNLFHINNLIFSGIEKKTYIQNNNKFLGECHINHDTQVYNNVTFYPRVTAGGYTEFLNNSNIGMCAVIHQRRIVGQYSMIGANNMVTKDIFPYYININNKIHRLNKIKIPEFINDLDDLLREIQFNFQNKNYDLSNYHLPMDVINDLNFFISKIKK